MAKKKPKKSEVVILAKGTKHASLYERTVQGEVLSAAEIRELERYEDELPAVPAELPVHRAPKRGRKVSLVEVRALGLRSESLTEAAAAFSGPGDLEDLVQSRDSVRAAWDRGRVLRDVRRLGGTTVTVTQAGKQLGMTGPEFRKLLDSDKEVRDLWDQERQTLFVRTADTMVDQAAEGKPYAIRYVENFLRGEHAPTAGFDYEHVPMKVMEEITGKVRQTIYAWTRDAGLPRNADCTYNLAEFFAWFEKSLKAQTKTGPKVDPLRAANAEAARIKNRVTLGELLERRAVENGLVARMQNFLGGIDNHIGPTTAACVGRDAETIEAEIRAFCMKLREALTEIPNELRLDAGTAAEFERFLGRLEAPQEEGDDDA